MLIYVLVEANTGKKDTVVSVHLSQEEAINRSKEHVAQSSFSPARVYKWISGEPPAGVNAFTQLVVMLGNEDISCEHRACSVLPQ